MVWLGVDTVTLRKLLRSGTKCMIKIDKFHFCQIQPDIKFHLDHPIPDFKPYPTAMYGFVGSRYSDTKVSGCKWYWMYNKYSQIPFFIRFNLEIVF